MIDKPDWSGKTILVVEDEEINRYYFTSALKSTNVELLFAINGIDAVKEAINNNDIDIVLMDIRLPGIDGYDATKKIKKVKKHLPIIAQSAYAMPTESEKAFEAGCDGYISKPIRINTLFETIGKFFG